MPDSLLKSICACIGEQAGEGRHIAAANEGNAVALAVGHYLASGKAGLVYMQNSGLGNAVNPLVSLADPLVYGVPLLFLIGWRGEPGIKDEPQHARQGLVTLPLLETLGVGYAVLPCTDEEAAETVARAAGRMRKSGESFALVARKGTFAPYEAKNEGGKVAGAFRGDSPGAGFTGAGRRGAADKASDGAASGRAGECESATGGGKTASRLLTREEAVCTVLSGLEPADVVVSTTGKLSREIYEYRERKGEGHRRDFLNVGSMGHASQIALGIALEKPERRVYCLDGDGAVLMHMGGLAVIGCSGTANYRHLVFNNSAHDSVGGQPTVGFAIDICRVAEGCGYRRVLRAESEEELAEALAELNRYAGPSLLEIRVKKGARDNLGRPAESPQENKRAFMRFLQET